MSYNNMNLALENQSDPQSREKIEITEEGYDLRETTGELPTKEELATKGSYTYSPENNYKRIYHF